MDFRTYLSLEVALTRRLTKTWADLSKDELAQVNSALAEGDFPAAIEAVNHIDMSEVGKQCEQYIRYMLQSCAVWGAGMVADDTSVLKNPLTKKYVEQATANILQYLEHGGTAYAQQQALQLIAQEQETVQKAERKAKPMLSFDEVGSDSLQIISSLHSNRLGTWGFVAEAEVRNITRYQLCAVMDGRTSAFCRWINGKTFNVSDAVDKITEVLSAQDPEDLKTIQPWPNQSKASMEDIMGMSNAELVAAGWHIPPFHPGCRTILVKVGSNQVRIEKPVVASPPTDLQPYTSTLDTFKQMGITLDQDQVDHWNAFVGVNPVDWLSKLTGADVLEVLDGVFGKNAIKIAADGDILTTVKGTYNGAKFTVGSTLDPYTGKLYLNQMDFMVGDADADGAFMKKLLGAMVDTGEGVAATSVTLSVGAYAYEYAKMGFTPSAVQWQEMRLDMIDRIESGDLENMFASLTDDQQNLLVNLLNTTNEDAVSVLADLPWTYRDTPVGELLLEGVDGNFSLDMNNPSILNKAQAYLQ